MRKAVEVTKAVVSCMEDMKMLWEDSGDCKTTVVYTARVLHAPNLCHCMYTLRRCIPPLSTISHRTCAPWQLHNPNIDSNHDDVDTQMMSTHKE